jgi:HTH-type transcriptional regulator/antitoxin HigA
MFTVDQRELFNVRPEHPGKVLARMMEERGWAQEDLARITGKARQSISEIVTGRNGIAPEMAVLLGAAFGNSPQFWLHLDQLYRVYMSTRNTSDVEEMAALYSVAPIREMVKRGWIRPTDNSTDLRTELTSFFGVDPLNDGINLPVATRRTVALPSLTPAEKAWCYRARQLARTMLINPYKPELADKAKSALRKLAVHPKEARLIPQVLADHGIRFVVIEPLPGVKIDGAALWDEIGPIIAVSIRHDRVDGFWFTVMHELEHIANQDPISVDSGMVDAVKGVTISLVNDVAEDRANEGAATALIPTPEMESFVRRVGPFYSKDRIVQFANRIRIHPGIIVGQLQHREELGFTALREYLVKIRDNVISTALTDGWGQSITPIY